MIVVDTNIITYALIDTEMTASARAVYERDPDWVVPSLWQHEFLNVLATFVRTQALSTAQAERIWQQAVNRFGEVELYVDKLMALRLSGVAGISAYDAQYIALADTNHLYLVTADKKLLKAFPKIAVSMGDFLTAG